MNCFRYFAISSFYLLSFFLSLDIHASKIDSLKIKLQKEDIEERVQIMCDLCWEYRFVDIDSAVYYGNKAFTLSSQLNDNKGIAQSLNDLGIIFLDQGRYESALANFTDALDIRIVLSDTAGIASLYNKVGIVYQKQGKLKRALEFQQKALEIYESLQHDLWVAYSLNNIAIINFNIGNYEASLDYHIRGLDIRRKLHDDYGVAGSYGNIANVLFALGDTSEAIEYYERALQICKQIDNSEAESVQLTNLGAMYVSKGEYDKALIYLMDALKIRNRLGDNKAIASTMIKIGESLMNLGKYDDAFIYLNNAKNIAISINVTEELNQTYFDLAKLYSMINESDSSTKYLDLFVLLKDSVYNARLDQQIIDANTKYEVEKKDKDFQLLLTNSQLNESMLKQRKTEILLLIFIIISIVGAAIFIFYRRKQKQKETMDAALISHNKKMIQAVINGQEEERRKIARELHDGVGQTLAGLKLHYINNNEEQKLAEDTNMSNIIDDAATEIRNISHQMMPKELEQFGLVSAIEGFLDLMLKSANIEFSFEYYNFEKRINPELELGLFRILQELIGNIIKHSKAKSVEVRLMKRKNSIILIVADDGKGFKTDKYLHKGIGLMNIESRADSMDGQMNFESVIDKGTEVTIRIPHHG